MERRPIEEFDSIMILADEQYEADAMQADSHSVATLMLMRACEDEREERQSSSGRHRRKTLNVVCEILDSRTRDILEQNAQIKGKAEYIHSNVIVSKVMAQIAEEPTIHDIMKQFLDSNGKEIFVRPGSAYCSDAEEKLNFWEMSTRVRKQGDILIGYCRKKVKAVNGAATLSSVLRGALGPHRLSGSRSLFGGMDSVHSRRRSGRRRSRSIRKVRKNWSEWSTAPTTTRSSSFLSSAMTIRALRGRCGARRSVAIVPRRDSSRKRISLSARRLVSARKSPTYRSSSRNAWQSSEAVE